MDKKELLKRWALAYTEQSLFYVPWKNNKEGFIHIDNRFVHSVALGGVFTLDGKLIAKVDFSKNSVFHMSLKRGTYIYKEAISHPDYELSNDVIFKIESYKTTRIVLKRKSTESYFKRTYEKIDPTLYYPVTPSEPYSIYEFEHYNYFSWVLRQYSLEDDSLIRTIYDVRSRNKIYPSESSSITSSNSIAPHNYFFKAIDRFYYGEKINQFEFEYDFEDEIKSTSPIWGYRELGNTVVRQAWSGNHISCNSIANVTTEKASWIKDISADEIFNIYKFIIDNKVPPSSTNTKFYRRTYTIWIYNNQYYADGSECDYQGFNILLHIYYRKTDVTMTYPEDMLLDSDSNYSEDYIIENNITDISKYFHDATLEGHNSHLNMHTGSFINQELLDIINNSESGGET